MSQTKQYRVSPIAAAVSAALTTPAAVLAQEEGAVTALLDEIVVTARKREENLQKIPATIHAFPEAMLKEMGAFNTEDYVRFMPSVNWINFNTGGNNQVIFRGVNTTTSGYTGTQSSSVYLDEIPLTATDGSQPDIRMMDVMRTEALAGPQGTLYGAAAQAGTLRVITNKPDTSHFEASADVNWRNGSTSDASNSITGVFNIPLVEDVFAIRLAAQSAKDGGYIDNVLGHTPDTFYGETADVGSWGWNKLAWGDYRNDDVAEKNWNSAEFALLRVSAQWDINENWSVLAAYHYGDTESFGSPAYNPYVGDLETIGFVKNYSHSEWDLKSLTIAADFGFTQFVSATSFFDNQRTYVIDNTLYYKYYTKGAYCGDNGVWADLDAAYKTNYANYSVYWLWDNPVNGRAIYAPIYCVMPAVHSGGVVGQLDEVIGVGEGPEWQERFTQEFRLSHQGETFDWLAGLYFEESNDSWNSVWMKDANVRYQDSMSYAFIESCNNGGATYTEGVPPDTYEASNWSCPLGGPGDIGAALVDADHYWDSRDDTDWQTTAVFGEVTWHATDQMNVTVGGRWFETKNDKLYIKYIAGHTAPNDRHVGGFIQPRWVGNDITQSATISEFVPKFSLAYTLNQDKMLYATYTEGYRTGGINRANKNADWDRTLWGEVWEPDRLKNYEMGLRSRFANNSVQLNLTYFYMDWEDFQHEVVDPSVGDCVIPAEEPTCRPPPTTTRPDGTSDELELPWISIVGNVGDAHSSGVTAELDWAPGDAWRIGANLQWLEKELDSTTADENSGLAKGQELPNVPELQGALWGTYTWPVNFIQGGEMFLRGQYSYTGETHTALIPADENDPQPSFTNDAYGIADLRLGLVSPDGGWEINLFVNNVTDERAQVTQWNATGAWQWGRSGEYEHAHNVYTVRPREYGLRFSARWGD